MFTHKANPGQAIDAAAKDAIAIARHYGRAICLVYKGIQVEVQPDDSVESVKTAYIYADLASHGQETKGIEIFIRFPPGDYLVDDQDIEVVADRLASRIPADAIRDRVTGEPVQRSDGAWGFRVGATTGEFATAVAVLQDQMGFEIVDYDVVQQRRASD